MTANHFNPLPNLEQPRTARWVALGAAATVFLGGCGVFGDAVDVARGNLAVAQMDSQEDYDYSLWPACAEPVEGTSEPILKRIAEQCLKEGSKNADLVVVDLTDSPKKSKQFLETIQSGVEDITNGQFTIAPRLYGAVQEDTKNRVSKALIDQNDIRPCVEVDDPTTYPSKVVLNTYPELKKVPYVVVLSNHPSCDNKAAGIKSGSNQIDILNFRNIGERYPLDENDIVTAVGIHELGHLIAGFRHVGTLTPKESVSDPSRYIIEAKDLTFGELDLDNYVETAEYREYVPLNSDDGNIMGSSDKRALHGTLMPHQEDQMHWWDKYVGKEYTPKVKTVGTETVTFLPEDIESVAGMAMLEEPITIPDDNGEEDFVADAVLWQPVTGINPDMGKIVESVYISLISTEGSKTALLGSLTDELNGERSWSINLGPTKVLYLNSTYGPLQATVAN